MTEGLFFIIRMYTAVLALGFEPKATTEERSEEAFEECWCLPWEFERGVVLRF